MYYNIPTQGALDALDEYMARYNKGQPQLLCKFILQHTFFESRLDKKSNSQSQIYRQVSGLPMGNPISPFLANLFMNIYEDRFIELYDKKILFFHRYLDDILIGFSPHQQQLDPNFAESMRNVLTQTYDVTLQD